MGLNTCTSKLLALTIHTCTTFMETVHLIYSVILVNKSHYQPTVVMPSLCYFPYFSSLCHGITLLTLVEHGNVVYIGRPVQFITFFSVSMAMHVTVYD